MFYALIGGMYLRLFMGDSQKVDHTRIARIENVFVEHARYSMSVREQKVILFLIARLDPNKEDFIRQNISIKELESVLKSDGKKWGGLYKEMEALTDKIISRQLSFPSNILVDGRPLKGKVNWFSHVMPNKNEQGEVCLEFEFAPILKKYLLKLREYVKIDRLEINRMKNKYSIRLYQIIKVAFQKQEKYKDVVNRKISVEELRDILQLGDKYGSFKAFNQFVLTKAVQEINDYSSMMVWTELIRKGRRVDEIKFMISRKEHHDPNQLRLGLPEEEEGGEKEKKRLQKKRRAFQYERFKVEHRKVYIAKVKEIQVQFGENSISLPAMEQSLRNYCEKWYVKNG